MKTITARYCFTNQFNKPVFQVSETNEKDYNKLKKLHDRIASKFTTYNPIFMKSYNGRKYVSVSFTRSYVDFEKGADYKITFLAHSTKHKNTRYANLTIKRADKIENQYDEFSESDSGTEEENESETHFTNDEPKQLSKMKKSIMKSTKAW